MAEGVTITTSVNDLKTLFNKVKEVWFSKKELKASDFATKLTVDMELPILGDGVTFNTGEAEITEVKLTTGANWVARSEKGDSDISLQVASIDNKVNELFMQKKSDTVTSASGAVFEGNTYSGEGYSLAPKKVEGALVMPSEDRNTIIVLPKVEIYASLVAADGENPAYFSAKVTPLENSAGCDIYILNKTA